MKESAADLEALSQNSELSEIQLQNLETSARPNSTIKATKYGIKKFKDWLQKRQRSCDFMTVSPTDLNDLLRKFYAEVMGAKPGVSLSASTLTGLRAAIHRHITGAPFNRPFNIIKDREFLSDNKMFTARCKLFFQSANPKPQHKPAIGDADMKKLGQYFSRWGKDPAVLVETVWFFLCFYFGRRGREGWTSMTKDIFVLGKDSEGHEYVHASTTEVTKNHQGGHKQKDIDYSDQRMYGPGVEIFKYYCTKLHHQNDRLFQTPLKVFKFDGIWFRNEPIGKNILASMMQRISDKADLSQRYTCHSVRASTVTTLYQAGISTQSIISVTKHKNTASLGHYINDISTKQKREVCGILTSALGAAPRPGTSESSPQSVRKVLPDNLIFSDAEDEEMANFDLGFDFDNQQIMTDQPRHEDEGRQQLDTVPVRSLIPAPVLNLEADMDGAFTLPLQAQSITDVYNLSVPATATTSQAASSTALPSNIMTHATFNNCTINFQLKQI